MYPNNKSRVLKLQVVCAVRLGRRIGKRRGHPNPSTKRDIQDDLNSQQIGCRNLYVTS